MVKLSIPSINEYVLEIIIRTLIATLSFSITVLSWVAGEVLTGSVWLIATILWIFLIIRTYNYIKKDLERLATEVVTARKKLVWENTKGINTQVINDIGGVYYDKQ